jgi:hypothetical protein
MITEDDELNYISSLEKQLSESLRPIQPDQLFIDQLQKKLERTQAVALERCDPHTGLVIIGAGLVTGLLLLWFIKHVHRNN